jgi:hypothetical protein
MPLTVRHDNYIILLEPAQLKHVLETIAAGQELDFRHMGLLPAFELDVDITDMDPEQAKDCLRSVFGPDEPENTPPPAH